MSASETPSVPAWAMDALVCPQSRERLIEQGGQLVTAAGRPVGRIGDGIASFAVAAQDASLDYYRDIGGAHFHERASVAFAMSTLETSVYHAYLAELAAPDRDTVVVDVGGGDGRNAVPWLASGHRRVIVVEPIRAALERLRARVAQEHPDWLGSLLLVEADARTLPLAAGCAGRVQAIEALYYLNEDYERGLAECVRVLARDGRLMVAERDYEGALLTRLLHGGVAGMLTQAGTRDAWDGVGGRQVRSRCFTAAELIAILQRHDLRIVSERGISALALILGHLRGTDRLAADDETRIAAVHRVLRDLGETGAMRRCHVIVAEHARSD